MPPTLFMQVLGARFDALSPRVRQLHGAHGARRYRGDVAVDGDTGWLARILRAAARLPSGYRGGIAVDVSPTTRGERWTRRFGNHAMPSHLFLLDGALNERLGIARCVFDLHVDAGALDWRLAAVRVFGLPLPLAWFRGVTARALEQDGRYAFDVAMRLPLAGTVVHYRGWLDADAPTALQDTHDAA